MFGMLNGVIMFGFILGGMASRLTTAGALRARYRHLLATVKKHLVSNRKPVIGICLHVVTFESENTCVL